MATKDIPPPPPVDPPGGGPPLFECRKCGNITAAPETKRGMSAYFCDRCRVWYQPLNFTLYRPGPPQ